MSGIVSYVGRAEQKKNPISNLMEDQQMVVLKDGNEEIVVLVTDPQELGGVFRDEHKGKKVYFTAALNGRKQMAGIKRGGSAESKKVAGKINHYVYVKLPASWSTAENELPLAPAKTDADDEIPFLDNPKTRSEQADEKAKAQEVAPKPAAPTQHGTTPISIAAKLVEEKARFNDCLIVAMELGSQNHEELSKITGDQVTPDTIVNIAISIYSKIR